ncbi:MAG: PIG-L family deacetylase [Chthonomonas sp.]|nr:PIG-L family deacetylase [Chthonomonas sp.]
MDAPLPTEKHLKRRKLWRRLGMLLGGILLGLYGAFLWQPYEFDLIKRKLPANNPPVSPDVDRLFAKDTKVLLITAHPDDSEYYIGSFLTKLGETAKIHQVIISDGDKGYYGPLTNAAENRVTRRLEAQNASKAWRGQGVEFLGRPDARITVDDATIAAVKQAIERLQPDYILAFDSDYPPRLSHRDHRRAGVISMAAARATGRPMWCLLFSTMAPNYGFDSSELWPQKQKLLAIHASQFGTKLDRIVQSVGDQGRSTGKRFGVAMAEGFRCVQLK